MHAGAQETIVTTGSTTPGASLADIELLVTVKPAGGSCAATPLSDTGDPLGGDPVAPGIAPDGSFAFRWHFFPDTSGPYLVCGWMSSGGAVTAVTSQTATVARPALTMSVDGSAKLPVGIGHFTLARIHYDLGAIRRSLFWSLRDAKQGCEPAPDAVTSEGSVTGGGTFLAQTGLTPPDGLYVVCAYLADTTGKEVDAFASSRAIVVGRGAAGPAQTAEWLGRTSQGKDFELHTLGKRVTAFIYPHAKLACSGTHPSVADVEWFGNVSAISLPIRAGRVRASVRYRNGNTVRVRLNFSGARLRGDVTDVVHPTRGTG